MSFLSCWQLRKQKTSNNAVLANAEHHQHDVDDNDELHKNRFVSEENAVDEPPYKREQNVVEKHQRHQQQKNKKGVPLIDSLRKSKKKCDKTDGRANGGVVPPWKQKMRAKGSPPTKKVSWEASAAADNIDNHKDSKDSYDYIDANECHDGGNATAFYSIPDNEATHSRYPLHLSPPSRYDYLDFYKPKQHQQQLHHQRVARRIADEPLYATASQIYSMGSEDPYSSIVSIGGGGGGGSSSAYYERYGAYYYRINRNGTASRMAQTSTATLDNNKCSELDALYAKIDRKASLVEPTQPGASSAAAAHCQLEKQLHQQQPAECESGSGSVGSSQPSYRYLTVREDVGVIRERIRLREQANLERRLEQERDDAYYSTIGNEYETVGEGGASSTNGGGAAVLPQHRSARPGVPSEETNHHLSINFDYSAEPTASSLTTTTPLPPTSPIPRLQPQQQQPPPLTSPPEVPMPPPFMRRPVVVMPPNSSSAVNGAVVTNGKCCGERTSAPSLTTNSGTSPKKSTTMRRSFFNGSSPLNFFNSHSSNKPPPPPPTSPPPKATPEHNKDNNTRFSRIPIFNRKNVVTIRSRTPSPPANTMVVVAAAAAANCADAATQTAQKCQQQPHVLSSSRSNDKTARDSSRSPLPTQVGQDYVSTIELSKKYGGGGGGDQRGWPLSSATASCLDKK